MAYEVPGYKLTMVAGEDLTACQHKFVKISANDTVVMATELADIPCGVLQNNPPSGGAAEIMVTGISKLKVGAGGALAAGNLVGGDAEGCGVVVDPDGATDYYYVGQIVLGASAGEICSALINCATPVIASGS